MRVGGVTETVRAMLGCLKVWAGGFWLDTIHHKLPCSRRNETCVMQNEICIVISSPAQAGSLLLAWMLEVFHTSTPATWRLSK